MPRSLHRLAHALAVSLVAIGLTSCHRNAVVLGPRTLARGGDSAGRAFASQSPDFSAVDEFWRVMEVLSADREPAVDAWQRFRATPGYDLMHRIYGDAPLEDLRIAFMPSRRAQFDSITARGGGRASRVSHLVRAVSLRPQLRSFRDSLVRAGIVDRAVQIAARYLPAGVTDGSAPPFVAFALFADDGYSFGDSVLVDLLHAYDSDVVLFLAHEFHHTYVERIATRPAIAVENPEDRDLRAALHSLRNEGIADLIDKSYPLSTTNPAMASYTRKYNDEYAKTPQTLRTLDSLLREVAANPAREAIVGKRARELLWSSGHANGAYMAREILSTFGMDSLLPATKDPAAFIRTFAAAEQLHGRSAPFSPTAMRVIGALEQRYWIRMSTKACAAMVDSALAANRQALASPVGHVPGQPRRSEPPRSFFFEFEVTTQAARQGADTPATGMDAIRGPLVQFVVGSDGGVDSATVRIVAARGYDLTRERAPDVLRTWRFTPATLNGCPVAQLLQTTVP